MAFWKQDKPQFITNKQHITASQQQKILQEIKLDKKDIKKLKNNLSKINQGKDILNPSRRVSLQQMKKVIKEHDPKLAGQIDQAFDSYQKKSKEILDEFCEEQSNLAKIKENIEKTKARDVRRKRGKDFLATMQGKRKNQKSSALKNNNDKLEISADRWNVTGRKTSASSWAQEQEKNKSKKDADDFNKIKEKSHDLPDLPI